MGPLTFVGLHEERASSPINRRVLSIVESLSDVRMAAPLRVDATQHGDMVRFGRMLWNALVSKAVRARLRTVDAWKVSGFWPKVVEERETLRMSSGSDRQAERVSLQCQCQPRLGWDSSVLSSAFISTPYNYRLQSSTWELFPILLASIVALSPQVFRSGSIRCERNDVVEV